MKTHLGILALLFVSVRLITGCAKETNDLAPYDEAVRRNPGAAEPHDRRGWARGTKGDLDGAINDFNEAIRLDPRDAVAYGLRGKAYSDKGELEQAVSDLSEAIRLNPGNAMAHQNRGYIYSKSGELDKAMTDLNDAIRLDPKLAVAYSNRGWTHSKMGQYQKALADFEEAIRLSPKDGKAYNSLAWLLATCSDSSIRDAAKAVEAAKTACELEGWKTWYCIGTLGAAYAEAADFQQAINYQRRAMSMPGLTDKDRSDAEKRLALYQQGKAYHEPAKR